MKLLTKEILNKLPKLYEMDGKPQSDVQIIAKFFTPDSSLTWYATEYDPVEGLFFGFANLGYDRNAELGYFSLSELESVRGKLGLRVERNRNFEATLEEVTTFKKR